MGLALGTLNNIYQFVWGFRISSLCFPLIIKLNMPIRCLCTVMLFNSNATHVTMKTFTCGYLVRKAFGDIPHRKFISCFEEVSSNF